MLIGEDYAKIKFNLFGLELLEPNAFIGDSLILLFSLYFYFLLTKRKGESFFIDQWRKFYLVFGISFFFGGLGHLLFNYWGIPGKYPGWFIGMWTPFFAEQAMISIYPNKSKRKLFKQLSYFKLVIFIIAEIIVIATVDLEPKPELGIIIPTINSVIGLSISLGVLGVFYHKKIHAAFIYLWISALILIPSGLFQSQKISFSQYFDRNDASHVFIILSLILYYQTLKAVKISA